MQNMPVSDPLLSTEEIPSLAPRPSVGLQRVLGHDLPNQLTALQGLLHLLQLEEQERLSAAGRDYVQRCLALCQRWQRLLDLLRSELRGLLTFQKTEEVVLGEVIQEAVAEVRQQLPAGQRLTYQLQLDVPKVQAPQALLQDLLRELMRELGESLGPAGGEIHIHSQPVARGVELLLSGHVVEPSALPTSTRRPYGAEQVLLGDLATLCGGELSRLAAETPGYRLLFNSGSKSTTSARAPSL